jgi:asparagine synthase (glutamine-hydrolysing)
MARRAGLEPPIPYTFLFPDRPEADEGAWQELVLDHLRLRERWQRDRVDDCDYVGPNAAASLRRDGVLFPPNGFLQERALEYARGGSVLTGIGGDSLFGYWSWLALAELLAGRRRPAPRDLTRLAKALLPKRVRLSPARRLARFITPPWLTAPAARQFVDAHARRLAATPIWWRNWVSFSAADPELVARRLSRDFIARHYDVRVQHPLVEAPIRAALARAGGRLGLGPRTAAMRAAFGEALPDAALGRESKADFSAAFWGPGSREFARRWDGTGVDTSLVEPEALRRDWLAPTPRYQGAMLLQAAWLAADRRP